MVAETAAVFFDVDFTLIYPGPRFQGSGYQASCARHGIQADSSRFAEAVAASAGLLDSSDQLYDPDLFINYTRRIIEHMGGAGPGVLQVAREMYEQWAEHHHFELYDDVADTLRVLASRGLRLGLISNSHRCLASFQGHFALDGLITAAVSSADHGYLKPHPSIFSSALDQAGVTAEQAVMVGDSYAHDVLGARAAGMEGILLSRGGPGRRQPGVTVIETLRELPARVAPAPVE